MVCCICDVMPIIGENDNDSITIIIIIFLPFMQLYWNFWLLLYVIANMVVIVIVTICVVSTITACATHASTSLPLLVLWWDAL